jgi:hypothetical protein
MNPSLAALRTFSLYNSSRILAYLVEQQLHTKQLNQNMNTRSQFVADRAIVSARSTLIPTSLAWKLRPKCRILALAVAAALVPLAAQAAKAAKPPPASALSYTLVAFEDNAQWIGSRASGITEVGVVPGRYDYDLISGGVTNRLSWPTVATRTDEDGNGLLDLPRPLPFLAGHVTGEAWRANELGVIVGVTERLVDASEWPPLSVFAEGVVWLPGQGAYTPRGLGVIDGRLHQSYATCVNNNGVVAGGCTWGNTINWHRAFIIVPEQTADGPSWFRDTDANGVNDLMLPIWPAPDPLKNPSSSSQYDPVAYINGLNDAGVVCGTIDIVVSDNAGLGGPFVISPDYTDADGDGNPWFVADAAGNNVLVQKLPLLRAGAYSTANAINASGDIAGVSDNHAVLWKPAAGGGYVLRDLGTVTAREYLQVTAMSNTGWILGNAWNSVLTHSFVQKPGKPDIAVVWRDGVMYLMPDLLTNGAGWTDLHFSDVSDSGVLAGYGVFNGRTTACLAVPKLP